MTDVARWVDVADRWPERARIVARSIDNGASVLDLGAGAQGLRGLLGRRSTYTPADVVARTPDTVAFDMSADVWPTGTWDVAVAAGLLEYAPNLALTLRRLRGVGRRLVLTYAPGNVTRERLANGWVNHLTRPAFEAQLAAANLAIEHVEHWQRQMVYVVRVVGRLSLLVPWRDSDGSRTPVKDWTIARWRHFWPDAEMVVAGDDGADPFCKSMAVNRAADQATGDVLAILDADTWVFADRVREAVELIVSGKARWVLPCSRATRLSRSFSERLIELDPSIRFPRLTAADVESRVGVVGFLHLLPREAFEAVGGMDERYRGWGGEDNGFMWAVDTIWGPHTRLDNTALHLWHPRPKDATGKRIWPGQTRRNGSINRRYLKARGDRAAMVALAGEGRELREQEAAA